ncbi:MAG TPA: hypothetical protein VGA25_12655 [Burkholderiales bacterium]
MLRKKKCFHSRALDRVTFEGVTADLFVLGKDNPAAFPGPGDPFNVGSALRKMIIVDLYARVRITQCLRDHPLAKAAVNEKDN